MNTTTQSTQSTQPDNMQLLPPGQLALFILFLPVIIVLAPFWAIYELLKEDLGVTERAPSVPAKPTVHVEHMGGVVNGPTVRVKGMGGVV